MNNISELTETEVEELLAYTGFVFVAFELVKSLIVNPIKFFYKDCTFTGMPFTTYEADVLSRHKNQFEACLLYLRDFMETINSEDLITIQSLRKHRNDLAHNLPNMLASIDIENYIPLLEKTDKTLFKLSNSQLYIEIGADPEFKNKGINWDTIEGPEYTMFKEVLEKVKSLNNKIKT